MILYLLDLVGVAVFAVSGVLAARNRGLDLLRDVITAQVPLILRRDIYATAAIVGVALYLLLQAFGLQRSAAFAAGMAVVIALRLLAIHWGLQLPIFRMPE